MKKEKNKYQLTQYNSAQNGKYLYQYNLLNPMNSDCDVSRVLGGKGNWFIALQYKKVVQQLIRCLSIQQFCQLQFIRMNSQKGKQHTESEFKTPKKVYQQINENISTIEQFGLKDSPQILQNRSIKTIKNEQKQEEKVNKIIRRIQFDDDQLVIKRDSSQIRAKRATNKEYQVNSSYTLDLVNSIEIRRDNIIVNKLDKIHNIDVQTNNNIRNESVTCRCKKTKCIKFYCECFQYGQECSFKCECTGCCNKLMKQSSSKIQLVSPTIEFTGCKCQKQNCSKKYCECLKRNQRCTDQCKCIDNCNNQLHQITPQILDFSQLLSQFEERN